MSEAKSLQSYEHYQLFRYVDVFLGLALLVSLVCLVLGARRARVQEVLAFLILSSLVLAAYWAWWACLAYSRGETEASKEVGANSLKAAFTRAGFLFFSS